MSRTRYPFWSRLLAAFSLILLGVNAGVGLLVYRGFSEQADRQRMVQRAAHVQALESVLTEGFDAFQTVARLVPRLAPLHSRDPHDMRARVDAALETFAPVIEAGHELKFFNAEELRAPSPTDARRTLLRAAVNANALMPAGFGSCRLFWERSDLPITFFGTGKRRWLWECYFS